MVGRITKKIELRKTGDGKSVGSLGLARKKVGKKDESEFFYFDIWDKTAENCAQYTDAGALVNVYYRLYTKEETIVDANGKTRKITTYRMTAVNVDFLVKAKGEGATQEPRHYEEPPFAPAPDDDTSLPFDL
jgi:single-strand DNA-binding protein